MKMKGNKLAVGAISGKSFPEVVVFYSVHSEILFLRAWVEPDLK